MNKREREGGEEKAGGGSERRYIWGERQEIFFPPVLKVPRQCPLILLVEVHLRECEALRSEKVKF
jgi:hypothetical protein